MGEGDEDVGEDDGGFGVDRRHTMMAPAAFRRPQEREGEGPPSFFFFLDLLPRWEKGSLWSLASMAWEGREPLRDWICLSASLCFCFPDSGLSPFLIFPEICTSDWAEILTQFVSICWLSFGKIRAPTALRGGHEGQGRA